MRKVGHLERARASCVVSIITFKSRTSIDIERIVTDRLTEFVGFASLGDNDIRMREIADSTMRFVAFEGPENDGAAFGRPRSGLGRGVTEGAVRRVCKAFKPESRGSDDAVCARSSNEWVMLVRVLLVFWR